MAVVLKFQSTGSIPGNGDPIVMQGPAITMGRGAENDVVLPDPDRVLSKRHCAIEDHNGNVVVVDISTNGTFLNYGKLPLGATPTPLNDGDILSVGPYELLVTITSEKPEDVLPDPMMDAQVSHGDALAAPSPMDLLDAPGDGGDFLDNLLDGRDGPKGPGAVDRSEPDDDGLLPPLGEDPGILPPADDPFAAQGASAGMHNPSASDAFLTPSPSLGAGQIPDDWDDLLAPAPGTGGQGGGDPFGGGTGVSMPPAMMPQDTGTTQVPPTPAQPIIPENTTIAPPFDPNASAPPPEPPVAPAPVTPQPAPAPTPAPAQRAPAEVTARTVTPPTPQPAAAPAPAAQTGGAEAAARAYLEALGAEEGVVKDADLMATMERMGHVTRIMIEGMREILMTRTSIKSEFRIERTEIQVGGNNPLKFSISPDQAVEAMIKPKARGYLDPTEAANQALDDIKAHEVAMVTGMEAALKGVLTKLDPMILGDKIAKDGGLGSILKSKKARYWELYEEMYADISDQAENDFHQLFAKEFARAYEAQLDKLK